MNTEFQHEPVCDASGIAIAVPIESMDGYAVTSKIHVGVGMFQKLSRY